MRKTLEQQLKEKKYKDSLVCPRCEIQLELTDFPGLMPMGMLCAVRVYRCPQCGYERETIEL